MTDLSEQTLADFPVVWRCPEDAERVWVQDRLHYPDPLTPLEFSLIEEGVDAGLTKSAHAYGIPITVHDRHINSYLYTAIEDGPHVAMEPASSMQRPPTTLEAAMANLRRSWYDSWLPEIQQHLSWWSTFDRQSAGLPALLQHLKETEHRWQRVWEIHFLLFVPSKLAISEFADLYSELFEDGDSFQPYKMIAGYPTKTLESGQELWALSRRILDTPDVARIFRQYPAETVMASLTAQSIGGDFLLALERYLAVHGQRADKLSLTYPYWIEDPTPVIETLKQYLQQPGRDLAGELEQTARQREETVAEFRTELADYPRAVREHAECRLKAAQEGAFLSEEHGYWIDYKASYCVRQVLLAIGDRLVADGMLGDRSDLFYLDMAEVKEWLECMSSGADFDPDVHALVAYRRAAADQFAAVAPPLQLGALADGSSTVAKRDPIAEMFHKVEGDVPTAMDGDLIVGVAGSPGVVTGTVKVVHMLHQAAKLQPGDILVADTTSPPWTLLFATAGGLVTNSGGILSHSAVIAREYGIPAVLGTGDATLRLRDGQRVEVDGSRGTVRSLE